MKNTLIAIALALTSTTVFAEALVYKVDLQVTQPNDPSDPNDAVTLENLERCGYPQEFKIDSQASLTREFLKVLFKDAKYSSENIQSTKGALSGGDLAEAYSGEYREKVFIVKNEFNGTAYSPGVYYRVDLTTFGSTTKPSGFKTSSELLNYRHSAELAEGMGCGHVHYKLAQ